MASVSQLGIKCVCVNPIDIRLGCTTEEVSEIGC